MSKQKGYVIQQSRISSPNWKHKTLGDPNLVFSSSSSVFSSTWWHPFHLTSVLWYNWIKLSMFRVHVAVTHDVGFLVSSKRTISWLKSFSFSMSWFFFLKLTKPVSNQNQLFHLVMRKEIPRAFQSLVAICALIRLDALIVSFECNDANRFSLK